MNKLSSLIVVVVFVLFAVTSTNNFALADDSSASTMTPIDSDVEQSIEMIKIDLSCNGGRVPNTMFTIVPSKDSSVTVKTSPANLVTTTMDGTLTLGFEWNMDVASTATSSGVRIGIPPDQLLSIVVYGYYNGGFNVQILDGFTNIETLYVETNSILRASMTSLVSDRLELDNYGGRMYVETNIPVTHSVVSSGGQSWVETPSFQDMDVGNSLDVDNGCQLYIKGDVDVGTTRNNDDTNISYGSQLTVTGTITGSLSSSNNSIVNAPRCDNVILYDDSQCNDGPQNVDVDVGDLSKNEQTLSGTHRCGSSFSSSSSIFAQGYSIVTAIATTSVAIATLI